MVTFLPSGILVRFVICVRILPQDIIAKYYLFKDPVFFMCLLGFSKYLNVPWAELIGGAEGAMPPTQSFYKVLIFAKN
jgi:hypothetical protein